MSETLRATGGPWDGAYVEAVPGQDICTSAPVNGVSLRYARQGSQLVFDGLIIEQAYVDAGLGQLENYLSEQASLETA